VNKVVSLVILWVTLASCAVVDNAPDKLSCNNPEIDCYRFSYASPSEFTKTVKTYAKQWSLQSPEKALNRLVIDPTININSYNDASELINLKPELIYLFGRYVEEHNKPREWLFVAEQAFIRSWNNISR